MIPYLPTLPTEPAPGQGLLEHLVLGLQIAFLGMGAVMLGLLLTYTVMKIMPRIGRKKPATAPGAGGPSGPQAPQEITAEVAHAIGLALFMDLRVLEEEAAAEITIKKLTPPFSPWGYSAQQMILDDKAGLMRRRGRS